MANAQHSLKSEMFDHNKEAGLKRGFNSSIHRND